MAKVLKIIHPNSNLVNDNEKEPSRSVSTKHRRVRSTSTGFTRTKTLKEAQRPAEFTGMTKNAKVVTIENTKEEEDNRDIKKAISGRINPINNKMTLPELLNTYELSSKKRGIQEDELEKIFENFPAELKSFLPCFLIEGIVWFQKNDTDFFGFAVNHSVREHLWNEKDKDILDNLSDAFKIALQRFIDILNDIAKLEKMLVNFSVSQDTYDVVSGGIMLCFYLWPHVELVKFKNDFTEIIGEFDKKFFMELDLVQMIYIRKVEIMNAFEDFVNLLVSLKEKYPVAFPAINKYARFWAFFAQTQCIQAAKHVAMFNPEIDVVDPPQKDDKGKQATEQDAVIISKTQNKSISKKITINEKKTTLRTLVRKDNTHSRTDTSKPLARSQPPKPSEQLKNSKPGTSTSRPKFTKVPSQPKENSKASNQERRISPSKTGYKRSSTSRRLSFARKGSSSNSVNEKTKLKRVHEARIKKENTIKRESTLFKKLRESRRSLEALTKDPEIHLEGVVQESLATANGSSQSKEPKLGQDNDTEKRQKAFQFLIKKLSANFLFEEQFAELTANEPAANGEIKK